MKVVSLIRTDSVIEVEPVGIQLGLSQGPLNDRLHRMNFLYRAGAADSD